VRRGIEVANAEPPVGIDRRPRVSVADLAVQVAELRAAERDLAQGGASLRESALVNDDHDQPCL
jgi:hypothetical protein